MPVKQFVVNAFVRRLELLDSSNKNRILRSAEVITNVIRFPEWTGTIPSTEQNLYTELDRLRNEAGQITPEVTEALIAAGASVITAKYPSEGGDAELTGYRVEDTIYWDTRGKSTPIQSREFFTDEWWDEELVVLSEPTKSAMYAKQALGRTQRPLTDIEINVFGEDGTEIAAYTCYDKLKQLSEGDLIFIKEQFKGTLTRIDRVDLYEEFLQQLE